MTRYYKAWLFMIWTVTLILTSPDWTAGLASLLGMSSSTAATAVFAVHALFFVFVLTCPKCGLSLFKSDSGLFLYVYHPWPNKRCSRCGQDHSSLKH